MYDGKERVLCFPAELLDEAGGDKGRFQGIITNPKKVAKLFDFLLHPHDLVYIHREQAEQDERFKQVIPYVVVKVANKVFHYQRTKKGGESRLHDLWSVGIGGHINPIDGDTSSNTTYRNAFQRELREEVSLGSCGFSEKIVGLVNDDSNGAGKVHFGVVHLLELEKERYQEMRTIDPALSNGEFQFISLAKRDVGKYETWSQLVLESNIV